MAKALHADDYLAHADKHPAKPVCAVFGDEAFLRRQVLLRLRDAVLGGDEADFSLTTFDGQEVEFRDVQEELSTVAMFGGGQRLVVVEDADAFVSNYREKLEDYVAHPSRTSVLVIEMKTFPANTRLYKAVDATGLAIDCRAPDRLPRWVADWAKHAHNVQVSVSVAEMIIEIIGPELGLIDQELAKLAPMAGAAKKIDEEMVRRMVGGWRAKTTWDMLDAALDGKVPNAMQQLDRLLTSGEQPVGLLGQISASLRRFAAATRLIMQAEAAGRRANLNQALQQAGVKAAPFILQKAERQLRHLTRQRGQQVYRWLLEADLDLKGFSVMPPRLILERLIIRLAVPAETVEGRQ
jgi:DNA polymerase III subunit delta